MRGYVGGILSQCLAHCWPLTNALSFCLPLLPSLQIGFPLSNARTPLLFSVMLTTQLGFTLSCFCWREEASITVSAKTAGFKKQGLSSALGTTVPWLGDLQNLLKRLLSFCFLTCKLFTCKIFGQPNIYFIQSL